MSQTAVTHGVPQHPTDLPKGFKPYDACERDFREPTTNRERRLRMVRIISDDQNRLETLIEDLGPPTGEEGAYIPCYGVVEMAHVHEMLDKALIDRQERKAAQKLRIATRHEQFRLGLLNEAERQMAVKAGRSVFGPHFQIERSS